MHFTQPSIHFSPHLHADVGPALEEHPDDGLGPHLRGVVQGRVPHPVQHVDHLPGDGNMIQMQEFVC